MPKADPRTKDELRTEIRRLEQELAALPRKVSFDFSTDPEPVKFDGGIYVEYAPGKRWITVTVELRDGTVWYVHTPWVPDETVVERRFTQEPER